LPSWLLFSDFPSFMLSVSEKNDRNYQHY